MTENTHKVIFSNAEPLKIDNSWMVKDVPYTPELSSYEKKLLEGTITADELLKIEKEEEETKKKEEEEELTEEEKFKRFKDELMTKVKVIALDKLGHFPLANPSLMSNLEKNKVKKQMEKILLKKSHQTIDEQFNTIITSLFVDGKLNYQDLPIKVQKNK
jgi:dGTP triphosphohydrolase